MGCHLCLPKTAVASDEEVLEFVHLTPNDYHLEQAVYNLYGKITLLVAVEATKNLVIINHILHRILTSFNLLSPVPKPNISICPCESEAAIMVPSGDHFASNTAP